MRENDEFNGYGECLGISDTLENDEIEMDVRNGRFKRWLKPRFGQLIVIHSSTGSGRYRQVIPFREPGEPAEEDIEYMPNEEPRHRGASSRR